jgi:hypothetical protein
VHGSEFAIHLHAFVKKDNAAVREQCDGKEQQGIDCPSHVDGRYAETLHYRLTTQLQTRGYKWSLFGLRPFQERLMRCIRASYSFFSR